MLGRRTAFVIAAMRVDGALYVRMPFCMLERRTAFLIAAMRVDGARSLCLDP